MLLSIYASSIGYLRLCYGISVFCLRGIKDSAYFDSLGIFYFMKSVSLYTFQRYIAGSDAPSLRWMDRRGIEAVSKGYRRDERTDKVGTDVKEPEKGREIG